MQKLKQEAAANLAALARNPYPGRVIIIGLDQKGENLVQVYAIMGRSENSRNRVFGYEGGRIFTEAANPSKMKDPRLVIYNAMREVLVRDMDSTMNVVSNGDQTDKVADGYNEDKSFQLTMSQCTYEPDEPNFTPRITATSYWLRNGKPVGIMSLLRKLPWSDECDRHLYELNGFGQGFGHCLTTYTGDGNPLPAYRGEPRLMPLLGDLDWIADMYWEMLDPDNRVSLAVKFIPRLGLSSTVIRNKYSKVA